jgi:hypothetical protein
LYISTINITEFYRLDLDIETQLGVFKQSYIVLASKEYILSYVLTGKTTHEINLLDGIIGSGNYESISTEMTVSNHKPISSKQGILGVLLIFGAVILMIMDQLLKRRKNNKKTEHE